MYFVNWLCLINRRMPEMEYKWINKSSLWQNKIKTFFVYFFGGLEYVGNSFAYVWIRTQRAAVESRCTTNLVTHLAV